ncbi:DUF2806 domain-containing protein [Bradyrhizobium sp. Arg816]|uniref:DUF2806 domain-containing protein n=1 Tax=Bradyrhizobium sp. Arg816 TaxID=2998491 RepID=UPI00249E7F88|nr:DUF2806 domain-containing protein [Bradyrhizobium sp. Arg816]MDI3559547.1 DUF2806 domain-containing protein [Bradyrhizobium sp. Arg816]
MDKAVGKILLAAGENAEARIKANTGKQRAKGKIDVEGLYRTEEERRKLENRAATVRVAVDELSEKPSREDAKEEIDDDWLNLYARLAEDKTSEELQSLFGKILAGELRGPGTFSLRTLQLVSTMSRDDAHRIAEFFSFVMAGSMVPVLGDLNEEIKPGLNSRILMEELGIATSANPIGGLSLTFEFGPHSRSPIAGSGVGIVIANDTDIAVKVQIECQVLTSPGRELIAIANPEKPPLEYLKALAKKVFEIIRSERAADLRGGKIRVAAVQFLAGSHGQQTQEIYVPTDPQT